MDQALNNLFPAVPTPPEIDKSNESEETKREEAAVELEVKEIEENDIFQSKKKYS